MYMYTRVCMYSIPFRYFFWFKCWDEWELLPGVVYKGKEVNGSELSSIHYLII